MYEEHYGLTERPFQLTPDARFWYASATHRKAMTYLGYGLAQGEGFIVVTGEIGAGKTTLAAHLAATIDRARLTVATVIATAVDGAELLRLVALGFGVEPEGAGKASLLDRLRAAFDGEHARGKRVLLIVDEAQALEHSALEELRLLSNLQAGSAPLVQIVLLGQPEFRARIAEGGELEQLRQRVIASHHLEAMAAAEIEPYVAHRLVQAGWTGRPAFDAEAFVALHRHSGGLPRRLNLLAGRVLLAGAIKDADAIDAALVEQVAAEIEREAAPAPAADGAATVTPFRGGDATERRLALLEAQCAEQETALRRVLMLLVDWAEGDADRPAAEHPRHDAA